MTEKKTTTKRKAGRKPNTAGMARVLEALGKGCTYKLAASAAGISEQTLYEWIRKGDAGRDPYKTFVSDLRKAENTRAETLLDNIIKAGTKDWRSNAWLLERRYGYRRDAPLDEPKVETKPIDANVDARTLPVHQSEQLKNAMTKAMQAQSWQAYAALQRQFVSIIEQVRLIDAESGANDGLDAMSDEQLLAEMEAAVLSMPPVMRQRLQDRLLNTAQVIPINAKG